MNWDVEELVDVRDDVKDVEERVVFELSRKIDNAYTYAVSSPLESNRCPEEGEMLNFIQNMVDKPQVHYLKIVIIEHLQNRELFMRSIICLTGKVVLE